jgi:hypothetical protein
MYFNKFPYISNFEFLTAENSTTQKSGYVWRAKHFDCKTGEYSSENIQLDIKIHDDDIYTITVQSSEWKEYLAQSELQLPSEPQKKGFSQLRLKDGFNFTINDQAGTEILSTIPEQALGKRERLIFSNSKSQKMFVFMAWVKKCLASNYQE